MLPLFALVDSRPLPAFAAFDESPKREIKTAPKEESRDDRLLVDWLQEMPEDLDVFIAQRYFEQAVELIQKSKEKYLFFFFFSLFDFSFSLKIVLVYCDLCFLYFFIPIHACCAVEIYCGFEQRG